MGPMLGAMQNNGQGNKVPPQLNLINNSEQPSDKTDS